MTKYNYIILGSEWDLYKIAFSDLKDYENIQYISGMFPPKHSLKGFLYRIHFNRKINNIINLPLKGIWNSTYFANHFKDNKTLCFIIFRNWLIANPDIIYYLRKKYPGCKIVVTLFDLISKSANGYKKNINPDWLKSNCDLVTSFDQGDCEKYGFIYHPLVMSEYTDFHTSNIQKSDIYMLGMAKDRLKEIYAIYETLIENGLNVDMILGGVRKEDRIYPDSITYLDGKMLSYSENLAHIYQTKCILEIMQKGGSGYTQRGCEAVVYGKKLLTNNPLINLAPFYNNQYISQFANTKDLDLNFVKSIPNTSHIEYSYKDNISPKELISFIEKRL